MTETGSPSSVPSRNLLRKGWRSVRAASGRQLVVSGMLLVMALIVARFSWYLPVTADTERTLFDMRSYVTAPRTGQDQRIGIVAYTDQTLISARKRSPLDRGLLSRALRNLDKMGAKAIGIDILFDQPQDEDDELVATLRAMKTPTYIGYAEWSTNKNDIQYEQQAYLQHFMERLKGSNAHPASVRLSNAYGATREWPEIVPDLPPVFARAMLVNGDEQAVHQFEGYTGSIRYALPASDGTPLFLTLPIDTFAIPLEDPEMAGLIGSQIAGRYVLIGGDIIDTDQVTTTLTTYDNKTVPGIRVHAAMIAQMLDGARLSPVHWWQRWAVALLVVVTAALTSLIEARIWKAVPLFIVQIALFAGVPFYLQHAGVDTYGTPAAGWMLGWILAYIAVAAAVRASGAVERRFAQDALGKYLPQDIAQEIIDNPERLSLSGSKRELFILFSDLEGFTKLSHQLEPEVVARLLNEYLDQLSAVVLEHGGIIDKYVGDAVVAFWGAPISRPDDGRKAALAAYAMWQAGEDFRKSVDPSLPPIGRTRVGQHFGEAVVGNFGGERRIQYTALGDAMNTAARLESANKALGTSVIASSEFAERSGLDWWRPLGRVVLRGRASPVDIMEPAPDFPGDDRRMLVRALAQAEIDRPAGIAAIEEIAGRYPDDTALANLVHRMHNLGENDAYVLG
ncbi:adenylate/guanylate cyclase domain-containing protein [Novosphingobium mangrovi (ex Huang et al. 2023)]|uniref:Adenylate/guanylate cyclase domain-containing protein n=1 Tax=Novosphingobium mangrovi (ex Huang et al. 2023) TaxID=2976432 RepID=A0ABT2I9J6_9SPHN|nr:adenylate/guanylate cyclase domain-containing protein [Novosphingobium mangrovi (ex Huang et al. 2023)]MCT2401497.1 adenylate/guanylate cyclase domain-containing protein [Novosphingobium mangrovi (ex Huang et al. 2023)]